MKRYRWIESYRLSSSEHKYVLKYKYIYLFNRLEQILTVCFFSIIILSTTIKPNNT